MTQAEFTEDHMGRLRSYLFGYSHGYEHACDLILGPEPDSEVGSVAPQSESAGSPAGPSPDGVPPTGSTGAIPPSSPTEPGPDPEPGDGWGDDELDETELIHCGWVYALIQAAELAARRGLDGLAHDLREMAEFPAEDVAARLNAQPVWCVLSDEAEQQL